MKRLYLLIFIFSSLIRAHEYQKITFPSLDGLPISAYVYHDKNRSKPFMLLFHQLGYSKGEYSEIAPKFQAMGFNVMAVDLRNGSGVNGIINETALQVSKQQVDPRRYAAIQDVKASIDYAKKHFSSGDLLLLGSSYSGSIVLMEGGKDPRVNAILAFSPGEYFPTKGSHFVHNNLSKIDKPVFFTSAKYEENTCQPLYKLISSKKTTYFLPKEGGVHGASALWESNKNHQKYWNAVNRFLKNLHYLP